MQATSRYAIIWNTLKAKNSVRISVPAEHHRRLKLAVIKRKNKDIGFKFLLVNSNKRSQLHFQSEGNVLSITLEVKEKSLWLWPNRIPKDIINL